MNDGKGTRYDSARNKESSIDLTLATSGVAGIITWEVFNKLKIGSDHCPIRIKIEVEVYQEEVQRMPKWRLDKANWDTFQTLMKGRCDLLLKDSISEVNVMNNKLVEVIIQSAKETIPRSGMNRTKKNVPWWNEE